jgi:uncharacterized protein YlxP (DUF503 family)
VIIGVLRFTLFIPESSSLKDKRRVLRSLKDRLRSQFNVSVAEIGGQDLWQRAHIGVVLASGDRQFAAQALQKILNRLDSWRLGEVLEVEMEIL